MKKKSLTERTEWLPGIQLRRIQYYLCSTCGGSLFSGCCTTSVGKAAEARCPGLNLVGKNPRYFYTNLSTYGIFDHTHTPQSTTYYLSFFMHGNKVLQHFY